MKQRNVKKILLLFPSSTIPKSFIVASEFLNPHDWPGVFEKKVYIRRRNDYLALNLQNTRERHTI